MPKDPIPFWKSAPLIRPLAALVSGILAEPYCYLTLGAIVIMLSGVIIFLFTIERFSLLMPPGVTWIKGVMYYSIFFLLANLLSFSHKVKNDNNWYKKRIKPNSVFIAKIIEEPAEKEGYLKVVASVENIITSDSTYLVNGSLIAFFAKPVVPDMVADGNEFVFTKQPVPIANSGNPFSFDYKAYCATQGIYDQIYLKPAEYYVIPKKTDRLRKILKDLRTGTVQLLKRYIKGHEEAGLAEALLIGYKDDLDKNLVQSYVNTGVVHIIAISGMQLALIYAFVSLVLKPLNKIRFFFLLRPLLILFTLWTFSILSGASASVLRAAVMLSVIVAGEMASKKTNIYNNLSGSAFILLCYNPSWVFDIGFQLSYGAVLSIVIFMKPIYHMVYVKNKLLDTIWQLVSVSLAAQILTTPISIYYFHQFPVYFLLTNIVAVPLSSLILFGELAILCFGSVPFIANIIGLIVGRLVHWMNYFIGYVGTLPFAKLEHLQVSIVQTVLCYLMIIAISGFLFTRMKTLVWPFVGAMLLFVCIRSNSFYRASHQQKLIVYNIPKYQAIDFVSGRLYLFVGDSLLSVSGAAETYYLRPARTGLRANPENDQQVIAHGTSLFTVVGRRVLIIDSGIEPLVPARPIHVDVIIISHNPKIKLATLSRVFAADVWIFDSSNGRINIKRWESECEQLGLFCYSVVDKGAFVENMD